MKAIATPHTRHEMPYKLTVNGITRLNQNSYRNRYNPLSNVEIFANGEMAIHAKKLSHKANNIPVRKKLQKPTQCINNQQLFLI